MINLAVSSIASIINRNPYTKPRTEFENLWKKILPQSYDQYFQPNPEKPVSKVKRKFNEEDFMSRHNFEIKTQKLEREYVNPIIRNQIRQIANKNWGIKRESIAIDLYEKKYGTKIITNIESVNKKIFDDVILTGKVDGITQDDEIIEVKNRIKRYFNPIPMYEFIQIQCYMYLFEKQTTILIECLDLDIKAHRICYDELFFESFILNKIKNFVRKYSEITNSPSSMWCYSKMENFYRDLFWENEEHNNYSENIEN